MRRVTVGEIIKAVGLRVGLSERVIMGEGRSRDIVLARQIACFMACEEGHSLPHAGRVLRRDPTTVLHARNKITAALAGNAAVARIIHDVRSVIWTMRRSMNPLMVEGSAAANDNAPKVDPDTEDRPFVKAMRAAHPEREVFIKRRQEAP